MANRAEVRGKLKIRAARLGDAERIAVLSTQLGYPSSRDEVERRLSRIALDEDHAVYVAVGSEGQVLGWVHAHVSHLVESNPEAEVGGLVVDEAHRGGGIGRLLVGRAEQWAREKRLKSVYIRSNVIRQDAHAMYKKLGYDIVKTQYAFRKIL